MQKNNFFLFFILIILFTVSVSAEITQYCSLNQNNTCTLHFLDNDSEEKDLEKSMNLLNRYVDKINNDKISVLFFYSSKCNICAESDTLIKELEEKYKEISVIRFDVSYSKNLSIFESFCMNTNIENKRIPFLAIGKEAYIGTDTISENLEKKILEFISSGERIHPLKHDTCEYTESEKIKSESTLKILGIDSLKMFSILPVILFAGLGDGINPCAFSILILLMTVLQQLSNNKKRLKKIIIAYILGMFVVNVLLGILYFYTAVQVSSTLGLGTVFKQIVAVIAIIAGIINIKDFFFYGKGISLHIPKSAHNFIHNLVNKASVGSSVALGSAVAILEAPCSVPIYLTVLEILRNQGWGIVKTMPLIIVYNIMFILPIVVLSLVIYFGKEAKALDTWRTKNRNIMRLIMGLIMLTLATGLILGWF